MISEFLLRFRFLRRSWYLLVYIPPAWAALWSENGLYTREGRTLVRGKFRRIFLSNIPPLARWLQRRHGLAGGCVNCGASCKLMFQCPHWDDQSHLCKIYEDSPNICRLFPITPGDIIDRTIAAKGGKECGFTFEPVDK